MSTIASPRQSFTISSRRDSTSTDNTARSISTSRVPSNGNTRRNRAALRDYYGLKSVPGSSGSASPAPAEAEQESELDHEGFVADKYVRDLLGNESLEKILKAEASLVSETRNLDGEKKALVYDNYSKLIAAVETIRKMRTNMDPLSPTTSSLTPAISHIAETAMTLSQSLKGQDSRATGSDDKLVQHQTVRWVLAAPRRLRSLIENGEVDTAQAQWRDIESLLNKWTGIAGVDDVRSACLMSLSTVNT